MTSGTSSAAVSKASLPGVRRVRRELRRMHPDAHCELDYGTPHQLLVATILSAQCTDKRVNEVTPELFRRFSQVRSFAEADLDELETFVRSTGFFRNKAKSLRESARGILERHEGEVPRTLEDLTALAGVGRKTANVILGNVFGVPGLTIDTHFGRVARRLGLTRQEDPVKVERDMMTLIPKRSWTQFSHEIIFHGRRVCGARSPRCELCRLRKLCAHAGGPGPFA